jgi:hypothetical protein
LPAHDPHRGRIHLQDLVLVLEHHAVAGTFKECAELLFGLPQGALRPFAIGVIDDAGANEILALGRKAQQPDLGRD